MNHKPLALFAIVMAGAFLFESCQDYGFEEVPNSVIRTKRKTYDVAIAQKVDILFVVDNSRSMVGEQTAIAQSFQVFTDILDEKFGEGKYQIAVITTGMESADCKQCPPDDPNYYSCVNETGENGRFQDRLGHNIGSIDMPEFEFTTDSSCKIMDSSNIDRCFYDRTKDQGVIFTGVNGCGYERGLAPIRVALSEPLISTYNVTTTSTFLRDDAILAVVVISDEEDCGEVGDVTEGISGIKGKVCYYAANGEGPDGSFSDPKEGRLYKLEPVRNYYDFLMGLKDNRDGYVKFATIAGMEDEQNPSATKINFESNDPNAQPVPSCTTPNCSNQSGYCNAYPGTRYIALANLFGDNGFIGTICQDDFSDVLEKLGTFVACPTDFKLSEKILDPALANILVNGVEVPRYSCSGSTKDNVEVCNGPNDDTCSAGTCIETWSFIPPSDPPETGAPGGKIIFAPHYNPCDLITEGEIHIEVVYTPE